MATAMAAATTDQPIAPSTMAVTGQPTVPPSMEAIGSPEGLRSTGLVGAEATRRKASSGPSTCLSALVAAHINEMVPIYRRLLASWQVPQRWCGAIASGF
jgi:hypothetical protein